VLDVHSPRVIALRAAVATGDRDSALAAFWREVERTGTPLVEPANGANFPVHDRGLPLAMAGSPAEDDRGFSLVTFLWRSSANVHVLVQDIDPPGQNVLRMELVRLPDTDVWFRTYRIRNDARFVYELSVNDPDYPFLRSPVTRFPSVIQADPLNHHPWDQMKPRVLSLVELPDAPSLATSVPRETTPHGEVGELSDKIHSKILGDDRRVFAYKPVGYRATGPTYPLLVFSQSYLTTIPLPVILDNMIASGDIPPVVAVFYEHHDQGKETSCDPRFGDFLATELLPWTRARLNATADPRQVVLGGASASGLSAACAALEHPEAFGNVLSEDGAFWRSPARDPEDEWLSRQVSVRPKVEVRFYLSIGLLETGDSFDDGTISMLDANRHFRDVLRARGYDVTHAEIMGAHDPFNWRAALPAGLKALLQGTAK